MISFNDAIKNKVDHSDEKVTEAAKVVRAWVEQELDVLAKKHANVFVDFLDTVPSLLNDKDEQKDFDDYFYLINDDEYLVHYSKDSVFLSVNIRKPIPEDVLDAMKISKVLDIPKFNDLISDVPFTVVNEQGEEVIKTLLNMTQIGWPGKVSVLLMEYTYKG